MKNGFLTLAAVLGLTAWTSKLSAQIANTDRIRLECIYQLSADSAEKLDSTAIILSIGDRSARVRDYMLYKLDSLQAITPKVPADTISAYKEQAGETLGFFAPIIYQNSLEGSLDIQDQALSDYFTHTEPMLTNWEIGTKSETIAGYECTDATITYGGRTWTVWFAPDLPVPYGPWKLCGLPGLILRAESSPRRYVFEAIAVRQADRPMFTREKRMEHKISLEKLLERKATNDKNPLGLPASSGITNVEIYMSGDRMMLHANGVRLGKSIQLEEYPTTSSGHTDKKLKVYVNSSEVTAAKL